MGDADLFNAALGLPSQARAQLAHELIRSLEEDPEEDQHLVELEWAEKIQHRVGEIEKGSVAAISSSVVFADIRDQLSSKGR